MPARAPTLKLWRKRPKCNEGGFSILKSNRNNKRSLISILAFLLPSKIVNPCLPTEALAKVGS
jgi:hypothetical protein